MMDLSGQRIGQYELGEQIGIGGMATVYCATQTSIGRQVAVKVLHRSLMEQDPTFLARFCNEVQIIAHLQHPYIVPVYDYGEFDEQPYLVMAYLSGGTLASYIEQRGHLPLPETIRLARQMTQALHYAHQHGVIHRDFKPGNVLMDEPGNAYLADFGLAHIAQQSPVFKEGDFVGTPDYLAPDWSRTSEITPAVDIYALGATLYEMLTGEAPYRGESAVEVVMAHLNQPVPDVRARRPDLPDAVQAVIEGALAKDSHRRFASARDVLLMLEMAAETIHPTRASWVPAAEEPFFPSTWANDNLRGAAKVLGEGGFRAVMTAAGLDDLIGNLPPQDESVSFPVRKIGRFWQSIYLLYGTRGLHALSRRAGQEIQTGTRENILRQAAQVALQAPGLIESKMRWGFEYLARIYNENSGQEISVEEMPDFFVWRVAACPTCWGWHADEPVCWNWVGLLEGELEWGLGKHFRVVETECRAMGDQACAFRIYKQPLR